MNTAPVTARVESAAWARGPAVEVSVVVATHDRAGYWSELLAALTAQSVPIEVVVVDDGSTDDTWATLTDLTAGTSLPVLALRVAATGGPSRPRNTAIAQARADVIAVTDDDCLPEPGWAAGLRDAVRTGAGVAQGRTLPVDAPHGPWDRSVTVERRTGLYETCNLGLDRAAFVATGGFPTLDLLPRLGRGFGEDVVAGTRVARASGFAWAGAAVVRHRWLPGTFHDHLAGRQRLRGFPWLARELPEIAAALPGGVFLSRRTAEYDAALAGIVAAAATKRLLPLAATLPWLRSRRREAAARPGRAVGVRLMQEAVADTVGFAALVDGSLRHRRIVL